MRGTGVVLLAAALIAMLGCGGGDDPTAAPADGVFVGEIGGRDAFVAVVAGKENVVVYACNGGRGVAELFGGARDGGRVSLTSEGGAEVSASITADGASGTLTLPGRNPLKFSAEPAEGAAGLYRASGERAPAAWWVVLNDGRQRGTIAGSTVRTTTSTATLRDQGSVTVAVVTPSRVSAAGFGGSGGMFGQFGG